MVTDNFVPAHAEQLAQVMRSLSTRTLNHFAEEAKLNGESLKDAFDRYEIDYAWHVLGSPRLQQETVALLHSKHGYAASEAQQASLAGLLQSAAAAQAPELLMSFDNEIPQQLAEVLCAAWTGQPAAVATA